ncbi:phosphatase PAP2 family protein [Streptomyces palmae]|uniref:Phosphatase PAP2 family protein n=2 Tax=Streptomyces palmae TaxID=1701085 RepID=A0A4Z0HFL3_9ACTN|nr:phosphatase PAP2 family protein [Streptomyces palmae]
MGRRRRRRGSLRAKAVTLTTVIATAAGALALTPQSASAAPNYTGDPVLYWNNVLLGAIRTAGGPPGPISRAAAEMNAAIYDAESSYQLRWHTMTSDPYLQAINYPALLEGPGEEERLIGRTAYNILLKLFPDQTTYLDNKFKERFGTNPTDFDLLDATVVKPIVTNMWNFRNADGSENQTAYTADGKPGAWLPTSYPDLPDPGCTRASDASTPEWGKVKPWALTSGSQYRPSTPGTYSSYDSLLASPSYAAQVEQVRSLGAENSTTRTTDQTAAAWFWANDANGTYKPPGQLLDITARVSRDRGLTPYQNARLFALVSVAMADSAIAEWDVKYQTPIDLWRPVSAIREGLGDTGWKPLSGTTPCFPAWASGHAAFAAAWAGIMRQYFKTDNITFTASTDEPRSPVKTRTFTSFSQAAREEADSRLWLGVHYPWDASDGLALGENVATWVFSHTMRAAGS